MPTENVIDIYGGKDPQSIPAYTVVDAAYYLKVNPGTIRNWVAGGPYRTRQGPKRYPPVITPARRQPYMLSFYNLIELHVLRALRVNEEIPLQRIRRALAFIGREMEVRAHPLVHQKFETDGLDLFVDHYGRLVNASQGGRIVMRNALKDTLHRIEWNNGIAERYFLWARDPGEARKVSVDPRVSFGRAVLATSGVPIAILTSRSRAGEAAHLLAADYGVPVDEVETALQWEPRVKA